MIHWAVLGQNIYRPRYECLANYLGAQKIENQLEFIECSLSELPEKFPLALKQFPFLRIDAPLRSAAKAQFKHQSMTLASLGAIDCVFPRDGRPWPEAALFYAFNDLFSEYGKLLDFKLGLLIVGAGGAAQLAVASAVRAGFSRVRIANQFDDQAIHMISELKRHFFSVDFTLVPQDRLVMLPGDNSLVINATPVAESNEILGELSYLNFLHPQGMIWDLTISPTGTPLIQEAEEVGIPWVEGWQVAARTDQQWLRWAVGKDINVEALYFDYQKSLARPLAGALAR